MEFDFNKLISYKNREKAEIGKKYYFFDLLDIDKVDGNFNNCSKGQLVQVYDNRIDYIFISESDNSCSFIYPCEDDEEKNYLSYEELKERWIKNPTELYRYDDSTGMITFFEDGKKVISICGYILGEIPKFEGDDFIIKNLTDINGNPLLKEK